MNYFDMTADLPRDSYCLRQTQGQVCQTRSQCVHCQLYQEMALPARYPVPAIRMNVLIGWFDVILIENYKHHIRVYVLADEGVCFYG